MTYTRKNQGTCTRSTTVTVDGDVITRVEFEDGCDGNLKGIAKLVAGMKVQHVIDMFSGICCESKKTSCPDQLAQTLIELQKQQNL